MKGVSSLDLTAEGITVNRVIPSALLSLGILEILLFLLPGEGLNFAFRGQALAEGQSENFLSNECEEVKASPGSSPQPELLKSCTQPSCPEFFF